MTPTRAAAIAALIASVSLTAVTPVFADNMRGGDRNDMRQHRMLDMRDAGPGGRAMLVDFRCGPNAAERLDNRFDHMAQRLELTADQQKLYDAFVTSALTAQTGFADTCSTLAPARDASADKPDLVERMETRLKIDEARLAALTSVLPDFKAFWASLTDEQKGDLGPGAGMGRGDMHEHRGMNGKGDGKGVGKGAGMHG